MFVYNNKHSILFKAVAIAIVCAFLANDISWAQPSGYNTPQQSTLAVQSRFKPFFVNNKIDLDFQTLVAVTCAAGELRKLLIEQRLSDQTTITREINRLNRLFHNNVVRIDTEIRTVS